MIRLRQKDVVVFSRGLTALYADAAPETLSQRVLSCLRTVFDCEFASFSRLAKGRFQSSTLSPHPEAWPGLAVHQQFFATDPAARHILRKRDPRAFRISDFVSLREYRSLGIYREVFGLVACDRRLGFAIPGNGPAVMTATLNRKGRDFSDEDRLLLNQLRAHFLNAGTLASREESLRAQSANVRASPLSVAGAGLGEIGPDGRVRWLSPRAETLLKMFFPDHGKRKDAGFLPTRLRERVTPAAQWAGLGTKEDGTVAFTGVDPSSSWIFEGPDQRRLKVWLGAGNDPGSRQLLLEEQAVAAPAKTLAARLPITEREAEVLHWLMHNKTNLEVALLLGISVHTAGRHVESLFRKLKVGSRVAAVRVALEAGATF